MINNPGRDWAFAAFGVAIVVGFVLLYLIFAFEPRGSVGEVFWLGQGGMAGFVLGAGTLIGAFLAAAATLQANQNSKQAEAATRFQKGSEMIAAENPATRFAGGVLLRTVAEEYPNSYLMPVVSVLQHYIEHSSGKLVAAAEKAKQRRDWPNIDLPAQNALVTIGSLYDMGARMGLPQQTRNPKCIVNQIYIVDLNTSISEFRNINATNGLIGSASFYNCKFENLELNCEVVETLYFVDCEFKDVIFNLRSHPGQKRLSKDDGRVIIQGTTKGERATINDVPVVDW